VKVARDALLAVSLYIPGINVEPCEELVLWEAEVASATFSVSVPPSAKHRLHQATAVVRVGGFKIAEVRFEVIVGQQGEGDPLRSAAGKAVHRAFASYAGEDRAAVLARVQGIQTS
jgi:hypothetical protein